MDPYIKMLHSLNHVPEIILGLYSVKMFSKEIYQKLKNEVEGLKSCHKIISIDKHEI